MDLSVIIVTWNSALHIARCLRSVEQASQGIACETIVVDNASSDRTAEIVRLQFPAVKLIRLATNKGFAHACNRGAKDAQGTYFCFVNPDIEVLGNSLAHLANFLHRTPLAAAAGGKLQSPDGTLQPSTRVFPTPYRAYAVALKLGHMPLFKRWVRRDFSLALDPAQSHEVDFVSGAFFAVRKDFFREVGGFDERYFIWFEEVDLMRQARERRRQVWYYPKAVAVHYSAQSFLQVDALTNQKRFLASMTKYVGKWYGWGASLPLILLSPLIIFMYRRWERFKK